MKINFTKLPTNDGIIKVSLDGGDSFKDYNIADIHKSGIPLDDNQDYEKIQIQAPANVLKNLNVVSSVKVENTEGDGAGSTNEPVFIMNMDTYGFKFPKCVTGLIIPKGITTIDRIGLNCFPNLRTIVIPDSVNSIGEWAFYGCTGLASITIPESVTSIGDWAFNKCTSLKTINYTGTEKQWNAIRNSSNSCIPSYMQINYNYQG